MDATFKAPSVLADDPRKAADVLAASDRATDRIRQHMRMFDGANLLGFSITEKRLMHIARDLVEEAVASAERRAEYVKRQQS